MGHIEQRFEVKKGREIGEDLTNKSSCLRSRAITTLPSVEAIEFNFFPGNWGVHLERYIVLGSIFPRGFPAEYPI